MTPSLPDYLSGRYRQYKSDTQQIATWLAATARKCGYVPDILESNGKPKADPHVAKTRKQKQKAKQTQAEGKAPSSSQKHEIKLKEFISLANLIAAFDKPPVEVPNSLFSAFTRAIAARTRCASWFQRQGQGDNHLHESNRMHSHFIGVLEETLLALRPRCAPNTIDDPLMKAAQNRELSSGTSLSLELNNIFNALELEEPSEDVQDLPTVVEGVPASRSPKRSAPEQYDIEFESEDMEHEMFFAAYCLFEDLNHIRAYIQGLWIKYAEGKLNLITTSITTNTAIELGRRSQADFDNSFEIEGAQSVSMLVQQLAGLVDGYMPWHRLRQGDEANFSMPKVHDFFFLTSLFVLEGYSRVLGDGLPIFKPEAMGKYDPNLKWTELDPRKQFQQDKVLLMEYLPEPTLLERLNILLPAEDAITRALKQYVKEKELPIHTIFATQVFLDIHHILGARVNKGFNELRGGAAQIKITVLKNRNFHEKLRVPNWTAQDESVVKRFLDDIDKTVLKDYIGDVGSAARGRQGASRPVDSFHWLSAHPLLCGMRLFSLRLFIQEIGVAFIGAWGTWWLAHLYNAVRQMHSTRLGGQILDAEWPDMDILIDMQGENRVFVGSAPTTIDESWTRMSLIMGYSAGSLAKRSQRSRGLQESKRGPRGLSDTAPVSRIFVDQLNNTSKSDATLHQVEEFFKLAAAKDVLPVDKPSTARILKRMADKTVLTPLRLLSYLRDSIESELPELYYDYLDLHRRCWELLRAIDQRIQPDLIQQVGPGYIEHEYQLPWATPYIFSLILGIQIKDRVPFGGRSDRMKNIGLRDRSVLLKATAVLKDFIATEGSVQKERLMSICGNFDYTPLVPASLTNGVNEEYARNMERINKGYEALVLGS